MITAQAVKELREKTGCGMMECKKALNETGGDMEKAIEFLRERGMQVAEKKAGRIASEGLVYALEENGVGVLLEVNAETDFVAKNAEFVTFVESVAKVVAKNAPADVDALKALPFDAAQNVGEALTALIAKIGENMNIRRFIRIEGNVCSYIHGAGKIGVLVQAESALEGEAYDAARDVAMQIAAMSPLYLSPERVPEEDLEKEKRIITAQIKEDPKNASKPDNIIEKMLGGKIQKFYDQNCLLRQEFVKDNGVSVEAYLSSKNVKLVDFFRFERGEGLEKKSENFADEVASMI